MVLVLPPAGNGTRIFRCMKCNPFRENKIPDEVVDT
jgi:hypothetical protein